MIYCGVGFSVLDTQYHRYIYCCVKCFIANPYLFFWIMTSLTSSLLRRANQLESEANRGNENRICGIISLFSKFLWFFYISININNSCMKINKAPFFKRKK